MDKEQLGLMYIVAIVACVAIVGTIAVISNNNALYGYNANQGSSLGKGLDPVVDVDAVSVISKCTDSDGKGAWYIPGYVNQNSHVYNDFCTFVSGTSYVNDYYCLNAVDSEAITANAVARPTPDPTPPYSTFACQYNCTYDNSSRGYCRRAPPCSNECSPAGSRVCVGTGYKVCGNFDTDSCLEYNTVTACANNICKTPTCSGGLCEETNVGNGLTDEACYGSVGCTGGNCFCNGNGACVSNAPQNICFDSDYGINVNVSGFVNGTNASIFYINWDTCSGTGVIEYYCYGVNRAMQYINCPNGCANGACIQGPVCGNTVIEGTEQCDSTNLNGQTCITQGYSGGTLGCTGSCVFNYAGCTQAQPDLAITGMYYYKNPVTNLTNITTVIRNFGDATAGANVLFINVSGPGGYYFDTISVPSLARYGIYSVNSMFNLRSGTNLYIGYVDYTRVVAESNEYNNMNWTYMYIP
jgi:hypothetical protein